MAHSLSQTLCSCDIRRALTSPHNRRALTSSHSCDIQRALTSPHCCHIQRALTSPHNRRALTSSHSCDVWRALTSPHSCDIRRALPVSIPLRLQPATHLLSDSTPLVLAVVIPQNLPPINHGITSVP